MKTLKKMWFVDIPDTDAKLEAEGVAMIEMGSFDTKKEALEFAQKYLGADKNGKISLISSTTYGEL